MLRIILLACALLASPLFAQPATPPPDATEHLKVVATFTANAVKSIAVTRGPGPPRAYLSERKDVVVLLKGLDGQILSRISFPDPLVHRVREAVPVEDQMRRRVSATNTTREHVVRVKSTQLTLFLPLPAGATVVEFHQKDDTGRLLGSARLPSFR
jgi:hypothetical protein